MVDETQGDHSRYRIGTVAKLTGLSTHTIRIWERRYGAVVAERDERGRRHYGGADVERLTLLKAVTERGRPIRLIANLDAVELRAQLAQLDSHARVRNDLAADASVRPVRVAVLGDFLPIRLAGAADNDIRLLVAETDLQRFRADVRGLKPDVLLLELATLDGETPSLVDRLKKSSGAERAVVVYNFGRRADIVLLQNKATLLRAPVSSDELRQTLVGSKRRGRKDLEEVGQPGEADIAAMSPPPPRRFTRAQLARLAGSAPEIECECPRHLSELVRSLTDFETYSEQCENRNDEDAALHAWLHGIVGRARALVETGLQRVVELEGLGEPPDDS